MLENHPTRNGSETRELVMTHIRALRRLACLRNAHAVLVPEDNLGNEAQEIAEEALRDISGVTVLARTEHRYGVRTDHRTRRAYVFRFADLLANSAIRYHDELVSTNPFITNRTPSERVLAAKTEFERQLRSFQRVTALAPSLSALPNVVFTGKADHEKKQTSRMKDDMVLAALLGIYWAGESMAQRIASRGYATRLQRVNAPSIAPVVRHEAYGGAEFANRQAPSSSSSAASRTRPLAESLAADVPMTKRARPN